MNQRNLIKEVENKINELKDLIAKKTNLEEPLLQIDIDLMLEKLRNCYDLILGIDLNSEKSNIKSGPKSENIQKTMDQEENAAPENENITLSLKEIEETSDTQLIHPETKVEEKSMPDNDSVDLFSEAAKNESFRTEQSISEKIAKTTSGLSVADQIKKKNKIEGLKQAIGINEKFYFINELFKGNMKEYNEAIENLDTCSTMNEAQNMIDQLKTAYEWQEDSDATDQLLEIIERKLK